LSALIGSFLIATWFLLRHGPAPADDAIPLTAPDLPADPPSLQSGPARLPETPPAPSTRDLQLALEAAVAERKSAEAALVRAQSALEAAEEQLEFRLDQGEDAELLADDAVAMIDAPFAELQRALRRLDQAEASEASLREELSRAVSD
jgi:hypothetical protein